jgi:predicted N-formylglutamate amidohydrolase
MRDTNDAELRLIATQSDAFRVLPGRTDAGLVIVCDHATDHLPPAYGTLGLPPEQLLRHIAYDIGVSAIVETLAQVLDVPAVLSRFSRLLIDPNRGEDDPTLIMRISDGAVVPGNRVLDDAERARRISSYYEPYHRAIEATIGACIAAGRPPTILSIHSFTDVWKGWARPWHAGVLWDSDPRLARPLIAALEAEGDLVVGDNQPYSGKLNGDTMWLHGTGGGLPHAIIDIPPDLIAEVRGQQEWADRLARIMRTLMIRPAGEGPAAR